jgi:hypothetical protein
MYNILSVQKKLNIKKKNSVLFVMKNQFPRSNQKLFAVACLNMPLQWVYAELNQIKWNYHYDLTCHWYLDPRHYPNGIPYHLNDPFSASLLRDPIDSHWQTESMTSPLHRQSPLNSNWGLN